jgi:hypothetical protein
LPFGIWHILTASPFKLWATVVVPPTLAQFALVCKVLILALLPCCTGSSFLLLHAAKSSTALASNHFDVVIIPLLNPELRCVKSPLPITRITLCGRVLLSLMQTCLI